MTVGRRPMRMPHRPIHSPQADVSPPVGLVDLPRGVRDLVDQQEEVLPHAPGQPVPLGSGESREGVAEVLIDHPAADPQDVPHPPGGYLGQMPGTLQRHRLHDADQDANDQVDQIVEQPTRTH